MLDAVCWRGVAGRLGLTPEDGLEVVATGKISTYPGRSRYQIVVERLELSGAGALLALLEARKKALAEEGPLRRGAQARSALPAGDHRRRHLAHGGRDPRHPASRRRALPPPGAGLAGPGPGHGRRRADRRGDRGLQPPRSRRAGAAARRAHRGARRRQPGGSLGLQRGGRGARRGGERHPADLRRGPRDRRDADRPRRRPPRADADSGRRDGCAGARRPHGAQADPGAPARRVVPPG